MKQISPLNRRLMPLYITALLQGLVLWYAIEKLFMTSIGFDGVTFGILAATYAAVSLLLETPSGILADRWSRKGVLMIGSLFLALASLLCGLTSSVVVYIFGGAVLWGVYWALYSGTYESIIYDTLQEETGSSKQFSKYFGRIRMIDGVALALGALLGGLLGTVFELRVPFLATVPIALASIVTMSLFREPKLHKQGTVISLKEHTSLTIRSVTRHPQVVPVLLVLIAGSLATQLIFEFSQLWYLAVSLSVVWYGVAGAIIYSTMGFGGIAAERLEGAPRRSLGIVAIILFIASLGLVFSTSAAAIVSAQVFVLAMVIAIKVIFTKYLHDELPSKVRAGSASAVSTLTGLIFIPTSLLFGVIVKRASVFTAASLIVLLVCIVIAGVIWHNYTTRIISSDK